MTHHHSSQTSQNGHRLLWVIGLNTFVTIAQVIGGLLAMSLALWSDALHNGSDVVALLISYFAYMLSKRKHTPQTTFGYRRAEVLAALFNCVCLIVIAILLIKDALFRLFNPIEVHSIILIYLAILSIAINGISVLLLHQHAKVNMNIRSSYLHLLTDVLTSIAVLLGGIIMYIHPVFWLDSVLTILIGIYLIFSSVRLLWSVIKILMHFAPTSINIDELQKYIITNFPEIDSIHHVHIWCMTEERIHMEAHITLKDDIKLSESTQLISKIEENIKSHFLINHITLQADIENKPLSHKHPELVQSEC